MNRIKRLSKYIDCLNNEEMPKEHISGDYDKEMEQLMYTVRTIKSLRDPVMPDEGYEKNLANFVKENTNSNTSRNQKKMTDLESYVKKRLITAAITVAFVIMALATVYLLNGRLGSDNIVKAMEQAYNKVKAYHGIIETAEINGLGEIVYVSRQEVWADTEGKYFVKQLDEGTEGVITINNGFNRWQIRPDIKKVYMFAAEPDPYRFTFDLREEISDITKAQSVKKIGQEILLNRETDIYEITPDGGLPYKIWVDTNTDLPIKKETAIYNALLTKTYYTELEFTDEIPAELLIYNKPEGFEVVEINPEQLVATLQEAKEIAGFMPEIPNNIGDYVLSRIAVLTNSGAIKLTFSHIDKEKEITFIQEKAKDKFKAASDAVIGLVNNNIAEILNNYQGIPGLRSIRWQQADMEYTVYGKDMDVLSEFAKAVFGGEIYLPEKDKTELKPQIEVPYDIETEKNEQKSVDAGHSPWRLDPVFVAQVFVNLLISPEGIEGEYEIPYENIELIKNDGVNAVVKINHEKSIAEYVYLKRLVRQDDTGIWTVIGYDPVVKND